MWKALNSELGMFTEISDLSCASKITGHLVLYLLELSSLVAWSLIHRHIWI